MKRKLMTMVIAACAALGSWADTETVDGIVWNYTVSGGKAQVGIGGYNGTRAVSTSTTGAITIPPTLGGNPVTSVKEYAFDGCSGLTSVTIPDGVTSIGENAFRGCIDDLFDTTTISGVKLVGGWAVGYTSSLSGYLDLTGVRGIADSAFYSCSGLTSVTIPDGVTSIGSAAFRYCSGLTSVTIPDGVTSLGSYGFSGCSGLTNVTIGTGVTSIGLDAFSGCKGLTSVTIPDGVTSIGENAFRSCSGLTSVTIPYGVTRIGQHAFDGCSDALFDTTTIPGVKLVGGWAVGYTSSLSGPLDLTGVRGIGESAFSYCSGLTGVTIPGGVARIGNFVFSGCSGLTSVTIPNSVTNIGDSAFSGCSGLTSVTIPNSVTSIGFHAFQNCSGLTSATIGNGVTSIAYQAFYGCTALADVKCYPDAAGLSWRYARDDVKADGSTVIHVKASQLAAYQEKFSNVKATFVGDLPDTITVTIGSGDIMDAPLPTTSFYNYSISHQIYTSKEIGTAGTIGSIAFKNGGIEKTRTLDIYLAHTDKSSFAGTSDWIPVSETDKVFSGSVTFIHGGWTEIPLDTPFYYNGMGNLAVIVDDNTGGYSTGLSCYAFAAPGMALSAYSDDPDFNPLSPGGCSVMDVKSQIQLVIAKGNTAAAVAEFADGDIYVSESETMSIVVNGGSKSRPTSVKVHLSYLNAAAADIDLKNATVDGETPKGGLKFPLTLAWDTGDTEPRTIAIPVKPDKAVEDDEMLLFQLADAVGMEMGETDICAVTVKDPAFGELRNKIKDGTATKAESNNWIKVNHDGIPYFCAVAMPGDGGKVSGSGYCPAGKKVTLKATANKGWRLLGWRQGEGKRKKEEGRSAEDADFVATTPSLVIDRTTKPAKNTNTSTTISNLTESTTFYAVFAGDPRVSATPAAFTKSGTPIASEGGKVTGAGRYAPGKKVTLKATANKNFVFGGWYRVGNGEWGTGNGDEDGLISQQASYSFEMGEEDIDLYARFVTVEEDKGSIAASLNGAAMCSSPDGSPAITTNVMCGVAVRWPIAAEALSQPTVKVAGLPSGLKFTAKDIMKKGSKTEVEVPANTIYGAPTAASKTGKDGKPTPSDVKITVTTAGKSSVTYLVKLTVDPLPAWAVGNFDGGVVAVEEGGSKKEEGKSSEGENEGELVGTVSLTIAASGKISGKILEGGKTWTLSAGEFSRVEKVEDVEKGAVFYATVIGKAGKEIVTNEVTVSATEVELPGGSGLCGVAHGNSLPSSLFPLPSSLSWTAWQNLWKHESWSAEAKVVAKAPQLTVGDVTLKFGSYGAVTASGKFVTGKDAKGKDVVHSASCSSVLVPCGGGSYAVFVYFPPKAGKFDGYAAEIPLLWDGKAFSAVSRAFGIDFYVSSETGDDSNDGKSVGSAFKTIDAALSAAADHQTVAVLAGSYPYPAFYANDVPLGEEAGGAERPVALVALYGRDKTFIEKSLTEDGNAARISGCASSAWSRFEGFTFRGCRPRAGNASRSQFACAYFKDCAFDCMDTSNRTTSAMFLASVLDGCVVRDLAISNYGGVNSDFKNINPSIFCGCLVMDSEVSFSGADGMSMSQGSHFENSLIAGRGLLSLELCPEPLQWDASLADSENGFDAGCWNCTIIVEDVEYPNGWADGPIFGPSRGVFDAPLRLTDCLVGVDGMVVNETYHASSVVTGCAEAAERLKAD